MTCWRSAVLGLSVLACSKTQPGPPVASEGRAPDTLARPAPSSEYQDSTDEVTMVGLLLRVSTQPHCGFQHTAGVMEYQVIRIDSGRLDGKTVLVAHGCPEIPRAQYRAGGGRLTSFRVGDVHRLELTRSWPDDGPEFVEGGMHPMWCRRADPWSEPL